MVLVITIISKLFKVKVNLYEEVKLAKYAITPHEIKTSPAKHSYALCSVSAADNHRDFSPPRPPVDQKTVFKQHRQWNNDCKCKTPKTIELVLLDIRCKWKQNSEQTI